MSDGEEHHSQGNSSVRQEDEWKKEIAVDGNFVGSFDVQGTFDDTLEGS